MTRNIRIDAQTRVHKIQTSINVVKTTNQMILFTYNEALFLCVIYSMITQIYAQTAQKLGNIGMKL